MPSRPRAAATGRRHSSSREFVLRTVESQRAPVSTAALARVAGLHENTVRGHLEQLRADGYVARVRARSTGRGRPAWLWRPLTAGDTSPYAALAGVLAASIARTSPEPSADARRAGADWGREVAAALPAASDAEAARRTVLEVMQGQGFAPDEEAGAEGETLLRQCPLLEAADRHPEVVCAVHRGLIDGILETVGPEGERGAVDVELTPFTAPGSCTLALRARTA